MEIKCKHLKDTWIRSIKKIWNDGNKVTDERGNKVREILNLTMTTTNPLSNRDHPYIVNDPHLISLPNDFFWDYKVLDQYAEQLIDPDKKGFVYTYGNRFKEHFSIDQIKTVLKKLKKDKHTRQAIMVTIDPKIDGKSIDIPCLQEVIFQIRKEKLHMTAIFRSNDIAMATFSNQYALISLGCHIAKNTNTLFGSLSVFIANAHIYETDSNIVTLTLKRNEI